LRPATVPCLAAGNITSRREGGLPVTSSRKPREFAHPSANDEPAPTARAFIPCPSCRHPIELPVGGELPETLECEGCGNVLHQRKQAPD
jgi:hypothetical protein